MKMIPCLTDIAATVAHLGELRDKEEDQITFSMCDDSKAKCKACEGLIDCQEYLQQPRPLEMAFEAYLENLPNEYILTIYFLILAGENQTCTDLLHLVRTTDYEEIGERITYIIFNTNRRAQLVKAFTRFSDSEIEALPADLLTYFPDMVLDFDLGT